MNSKSTTRYLPLILVIALVLTFGLLMAYVAPTVDTAHALVDHDRPIPVFEGGRASVDNKTYDWDGETSFYTYLFDLTWEYDILYKQYAETVSGYTGTISAVLYTAIYDEEEDNYSAGTRLCGMDAGELQTGAQADDDVPYNKFQPNTTYVVSLDWTANGAIDEDYADFVFHVGTKKFTPEFGYTSPYTFEGDYCSWVNEDWAGGPDDWFTPVAGYDQVFVNWYYMDGDNKVYVTEETSVGTYYDLYVELSGRDEEYYTLNVDYGTDEYMTPLHNVPSITIKKAKAKIVEWRWTTNPDPVYKLTYGDSIPYTGAAPAFYAKTNVGVDAVITWSAGESLTMDAYTGEWSILNEDSSPLYNGEYPVDVNYDKPSEVYFAVASLADTDNYDGITTTSSDDNFLGFKISKRPILITWDVADPTEVQELGYNGAARNPGFTTALNGLLAEEAPMPELQYRSDDPDFAEGKITTADYWTYTIYMDDDDRANYTLEDSYTYPNDEVSHRYKIVKGTVDVTITQKEDAHFYYRKAVTAVTWQEAYSDNFDVTITANGADGIFIVDQDSWMFENAKGATSTLLSVEDAFNHPGDYKVYVSTKCYIRASGPIDSETTYYVLENETIRKAVLNEDYTTEDNLDNKELYVVSAGDGDDHYYNKYSAVGTLTIEKAPVYVRTSDSFIYEEDTIVTPDENSYTFYIYSVDDGNEWDAIFGDDWYVELTGEYWTYAEDDKTFYYLDAEGYHEVAPQPEPDLNIEGLFYKATPFIPTTSNYEDAGTYPLEATIFDGDYCTWSTDYEILTRYEDAGAFFVINPYAVTVEIEEPNWTYDGTQKSVTAYYLNTKNQEVPISSFSYVYASGAEGYPDRINVTGDAFKVVFEITDTNYIAESRYNYTLIDDGRSVRTDPFLVQKNMIALSSSYPASESDYGVPTGLYIVRPTVTGFVEGVAPSPTSAKYYWAVANSFEPYPYDPSTNWTDSSVTAFDQYANVGSYWIMWVLEYQNYATIITHKTHVINKVSLTVVAENKNVTYGDAAPSYTYYLDGFVEGEDADTLHNGTLTGAPTLSCSYAQWSGVGDYTINVSSINTLAATNYSFADEKVTAGTLTVGKADYRLPRGVEQKYGADGKIVYTGGNLSANGKVDIAYGKLREADVITVFYKLHDAEDIPANWYTSIPTLENAAAGYYDIDYKFVNSNYNDFASTFTITVSPANISGHFQLDPEKSFVYTGSAQTPALLNTLATVDGADITLAFSLNGVDYDLDTFPTFTNVSDSCTVYWHGTADNHNMVGGSITVTMTPKEVTVTFNVADLKKTYDGSNFTPSGANAVVNDVVDGQSLSVVFEEVNNSNAGGYTGHFTLEAGANTTLSNYTLQASEEEPYPGAVNGNYSVSAEVGYVNVAITQKLIAYKQQIDGEDATSVTYGGGKVFTLVPTNLVEDDIVNLKLATVKNGEGVASITETDKADYTYYVKKDGAAADNYYFENGVEEQVTFTIAEKTINVTYALVNYGEFTYGDTTGFNNLKGINNKANFYGMLTLSEALTGGEAVADVIDLSFKKGGEITEISATADVGKYVLYATRKAGVTNYAFNFIVNSDEKAYINIVQKALTARWDLEENGELHEDNADHWFEFVYDGTAKQAYADLVGVEDGDDVSIVYSGYSTVTNVWTNGGHHATTIVGIEGDDAGNYSIDLTQAWHVNYFVILPKPITVQWGSAEFTYDGENHAPTVGITGGSLVAGDAADISLVEPTKQINANAVNAHYTATVSLSGNKAANYTITNSTCDFTIAPYEVTPALYIDDNLVDDNASVTYDGANHVFVVKATGLNEDEVIFYTSVNDENINVFNNGTGYNAGYRGHATGVFDNNYAVDENCYFNWAITARPLSLNWELEANGSFEMLGFSGGTYKTFTFVYNGTVQHPVAELLNVVGDEDVEIVYPAGIKNAITNGGYHAYEIVSFKGNDKNNYAWANDAEKKVFFDMQAKPITVTIHDKTSVYGESTVGYTADAEGVVEGDEEKTLFSLECVVTSESAVGYYDIVGTRLDTNYAITFLNGEDAYSITNAPLTVAVNVAGVTYGTAIKAPVVGDGITVTGWKNQDDATLIGEDQLTIVYIEKEDGKTIDEQLKALSELMDEALMDAESEEEEEEMYNAFIAPYLAAPTNAGTYYVYVFVEAGEEGTLFNYESADAYAEFTIAKAALTLSVSVADTTYGTAVVAPVLSNANDKGITINGWKYEDKAESLLNQANMSLVVLYFAKNADMTFGQQYAYEFGQIDFTNQAAVMQFMAEKSAVPTQAGEYYVFVKAQYLANYNDIEGYTHFTIAPKAVTVAYSDEVKNVVYGDVDALLALSLEMGMNSYYLTADLAAGDNIYDIVGVKIVDADGEEVAPSDTTEVGTYYLQAIDLGNPNYAVTIALGEKAKLVFGNATLADVSVAQTGAMTYNKTAQTAAVATAATAVNKMAVTFTYATAANGTYAAAVPAFTDAGTYTVYYKVAAANHDVATGSFVVTIAPKAITVTAENKESDYEAALVALTFTKAGIEEGDVVCTIATTADNTKVGTYPITLTSTNNSNYIVTLTNGTYTIKAKAAKVETNEAGEKVVENTETISEEAAKSSEGVNITNMIQNVINAAADAPVVTLEFAIGEDATVAFDKAALEKLAAGADVKISYKETRAADVDQSNKDIKSAQLVIEISLNGATFEGGKATITTKFENKAPGGKKAVVYYVDENGKKTDMNATFENGEVTFETTHFSTYVVEYVLTGGSIAGIVVACVVGAAGIAVGVFFFLKKRKANGGNGGEAAADEAATETPADAE